MGAITIRFRRDSEPMETGEKRALITYRRKIGRFGDLSNPGPAKRPFGSSRMQSPRSRGLRSRSNLEIQLLFAVITAVVIKGDAAVGKDEGVLAP